MSVTAVSAAWSGCPFMGGLRVLALIVSPEDKRALRIGARSSPANLVPSSLHVSTCACNPVTAKFPHFFTNMANNGAASNSG